VTQLIVDLFASGGFVMVPLAVVALMMGYLMVERYLYLRSERLLMDARIHEALERFFQGDEDALTPCCEGLPCAAGRLLGKIRELGRSQRNSVRRILKEMEKEEIPRFFHRLNLISVMTVVAPLLGLLGTVSGMIFAFDIISVHGTGDPHALSGGIGRALVSTQTGLLVALPGIFAHSWLLARAQRLSREFQRIATHIMRRMKGDDNGAN
jgi:biopolymer transport protein ExbB